MTDKMNVQYESQQGWNTDWFTLLEPELQSTATRTSEMQINIGNEGVIIEVVLANEAGNFSGTPTVYTKDNAGTAITLVAFTALTAAGTTVYWVHPHADKSATVKNSFTEMGTTSLPRVWYFSIVYSGTPASDKMDTKVYACYVK